MTAMKSETAARIRFVVGQHVMRDGRVLKVLQPNPGGGVVLRDLASGAVETLTASEVLREYANDNLEFVEDPDLPQRERGAGDCVLADVPERLLDEAYRRKAYCEAVEAEGCSLSKKPLAAVIARVAAQRGDVRGKPDAAGAKSAPSPSTLRRWLARWTSSGRDLRALVPAVHLRGNRKRKLSSTFGIPDGVLAEMDEAVLREYLRPERPTKQMAHDAAVAVIERRNEERRLRGETLLRIPSYRAISAWLDRQDHQVVTAAREGLRKAKRLFTPVQQGPVAIRPLEIVETDHTVLDVWAIDESGVPLGRPTLTVLIDRCTRVVVGFHLGFDKAGAGPLMCALRNGVMPKTYLPTEWPEFPAIPAEWPVFGRPETLVVDNGPEFHSRAFKLACEQLGIAIQYSPAGSPWFKGIVERWFRTCAVKFVHRLPGTTFSNVVVKGDYKPQKMAVMTLRQIRYALTHFIVADYNRSLHKGIDDRPLRLWEEKVRSFPVVPVKRKDLDCLLGGIEERCLTAEGVHLFGLRYLANEETVSLLRRLGDSVTVTVRYDPMDLGQVKVYDADRRCYLTMRAARPDYADGLSSALHRRLRKIKLQQGSSYVSVGELARARDDLRRLYDEWGRDKRTKGVAELARLLRVQDSQALFGDLDETFPDEEAPAIEAGSGGIDAEEPPVSAVASADATPKAAKRATVRVRRVADQAVSRQGRKAAKGEGGKPEAHLPVAVPEATPDDDDFANLPIRVQPGRSTTF